MNPADMTRIDPAYLRPRLLGRENETHKRSYGHLLVIAGCEAMPGAAVLATGAALQSGCGLVTLHSTARALQATVDSFPSARTSAPMITSSGITAGASPRVGAGLLMQ